MLKLREVTFINSNNIPYNLKVHYKVRYDPYPNLIMYLTLTHEKDPKDPNVPSLRYVKIPKKTMKKTLITYLKPTYLQHFSPDPKY